MFNWASLMRTITLVLASIILSVLVGGGLSAGAATPVPPPSGLVSWWPGDGNALDIVDIVDGNDGTLVGNATFGPGKVGQVFSISDAGANGVRIAHNANLNPTAQGISVDAWVNLSSLSHTSNDIAMVAVKNFDIGVVPFALGHSSPSGPAGGIFGANNFWFGIYNGTWHVAKGFAPTTGVWYHVTGTWDGSTSSLYVDGSLVASVPFVSAPLANPNEASIGAATRWGRSGHLFTFNGLIDEVELFNRALSLTEIQAIFNAGSAGKIHPLDIATLSLPAATAGEPYFQALITIGGTPPYSFSVVSGSLPAGLGLSSAGVISGTPTGVGWQ